MLLIGLALVACGSDPIPPDAAQPSQGGAAGELPAEQAEMASVQGEALPGRLLFVQNGTIWLWQDRQGRSLIGDGNVGQPAWSPDGSRIAYIEYGDSYSDLMLADSNGVHLDQLTFNGSNQPLHSHERIYDSIWAFYPAWAPEGDSIVVASQYAPPVGSPAVEYHVALFTLPSAGGARQIIHASEEGHCGRAAFAPDGTYLVYTHAATGNDGEQHLHRLDVVGGADSPFPGAPPQSYDPALSPSGQWLAFAASADGRTDIWVLPANATAGSAPLPQRLTNLGRARSPVFSPDGAMLAFLAIPEGQGQFELWAADLSLDDTGMLRAVNPRQITHDLGLDADSGLSWAP